MRIISTLIIVLAATFSSIAQTGLMRSSAGFTIYTRPGDVAKQLNEFGLTDAQFDAIKNDMYISDKFLYGNIYENGKEIAKGLPMRYNAYTDDVEVKLKSSDSEYQTLTKDPEVSAKTLSEHYVFVPITTSKERSGFMDVLVEGKTYKLYKKTIAEFKPAVKATTSYDSDTPASFYQKEYYYLVKDGNLKEIPNRRSKARKFFEDENNQMKDWIKKNKIRFNDPDDYIRTVEHLNSI